MDRTRFRSQPGLARKRFPFNKLTFLLFTLPAVILYSFFYVGSVLSGLKYSFTDWNGLNLDYRFVGLDNYVAMFKNVFFWRSLTRTLQYAALMVASVTLLSLAIALTLNRVKRFKVFVKSVFFFPAMLGSVVVALIWDQMFYRVLPIVGEWFGFLWQSPLASRELAIYGVLFVNVWQAVAIPTIILIAGLQSISDELYEAAEIDGAGKLKQLLHITLPLLLPTLTVIIVLSLKGGLTTFDYAFALTGGGPNRATEFIGLMIYNDGFKDSAFSQANAKAVVLFLIIAAVSFVQIKFSQRRSP